jgi:t-SNARE complex subunit (syntaxin)
MIGRGKLQQVIASFENIKKFQLTSFIIIIIIIIFMLKLKL